MKIKDYLPILLIRLGLGIVFFWFGIDKFINPDFWVSWIPNAIIVSLPFSKIIFIYILGVIELTLGGLLLIGLFTRLASLFVVVHLVGVILSIGFNDVAVRDFGLLMIAIALTINKVHLISLDNYRK